jgi:hypothetical protein
MQQIVLVENLSLVSDFFYRTFNYEAPIKETQQPLPHCLVRLNNDVSLVLVERSVCEPHTLKNLETVRSSSDKKKNIHKLPNEQKILK